MKNTAYLKPFAKYVSLNVLGMLGLSCYILADTFFVAKALGTNGLAALNLALPVYSLIHGCGLLLGMGGATKFAIFKSRKEPDCANRAFTNTILLTLGFVAVFCVTGVFFAEMITRALGADAAVFQMSKTYLQVILLFAPVFLLNNVLLCFARNDGAPRLAMVAMVGGSLSNIVLDYVFLFPCGMGMFGAVLATGLAPVISMLLLTPFFFRRKNTFHLSRCKLAKSLVFPIISGGLPSLIAEVSSGVVILIFNAIVMRLQGNVGVAAYGIIANLSLVALAIYTGIAQGVQPLISYHHATGNHTAVQALLRYALLAMLAISIVGYACVFFGAHSITGAFNSGQNALLEQIAVPGLRIYFTGCAFAGWNMILCVYFTSTEYARPAHMIASLRGFFIIIPMAFLLAAFGGMTGVWCVFPVTELLVSGAGALCYAAAKRRCGQANQFQS